MQTRHSSIRRVLIALAVTFSGVIFPPRPAASQQPQITSPEKFFGFQLGSDRKIARWDKIVEYLNLLGKESPRLSVADMGPSTMGNPFLVVTISAPANLARLEQLRRINSRLSDPRGLGESEVAPLIADGKAVIIQSMSLHATEIGGTQMAAELAFDLAARTDAETQRILDNVIFLMVPCFNPDGQIMVTDWYNKTLGTDYEGSNYPSLYHKYVGHDNNRDAFQTNMVESRYMAKILFREWIPQAYVDHHHMGSYGARIYVPPYAEPVRPSGDPLVWREMSWYGAHIAYKEEEAGLSGVINSAIYSGWGHFGFHWVTPFHNVAGMLTESASARLATPLYIHPDQLRGETRGLPEYDEQTTFPNPWPGGWWRLRDIVERQKVSAWAVLDLAARNRETVLRNAYHKARRQTERGAAGKPAAFIIPAEQHDPPTAIKMINKLLVQGIEVHRSQAEFIHEGKVYRGGTFVVSMAQPKMGLIRYLLGRTLYPDNSYTRDREGNPIRPYDMSTDTMAEFMGIRVDPAETPVRAGLSRVDTEIPLTGKVAGPAAAYVLDGRLNDSYRAVNQLLAQGVKVRRVDEPVGPNLRPGDFIVPAGTERLIGDIARRSGADFGALSSDVRKGTHDLKRLRIGMYQRYLGGNIDEGWTRWILEQWDFPFVSLMDKDIKEGNLNSSYDVIILPSDSPASMTGERRSEGGGRGGGFGRGPEAYPPEYRSGFGREGVDALKSFVEKGGVLLTFGEAGSLPIERFDLPLRNVVAGKKPLEFWCPGSTLKASFDSRHPLGYGMPEKGWVVFLAGSQVYEIAPTDRNDQIETLVTFAERDILQSGWLLGEAAIAKKAAMVAARLGSGKVILIGFRPQHRAQTHGTFKLVFNALFQGPDTPPGPSQ